MYMKMDVMSLLPHKLQNWSQSLRSSDCGGEYWNHALDQSQPANDSFYSI